MRMNVIKWQESTLAICVTSGEEMATLSCKQSTRRRIRTLPPDLEATESVLVKLRLNTRSHMQIPRCTGIYSSSCLRLRPRLNNSWVLDHYLLQYRLLTSTGLTPFTPWMIPARRQRKFSTTRRHWWAYRSMRRLLRIGAKHGSAIRSVCYDYYCDNRAHPLMV
jgi:hypothetical protein